MTMLPCIYCRRADVPRTREHVLQDAFGAAAILPTQVCQDCNGAFSPIDKSFVEAVKFFHTGENMFRLLGLGQTKGEDGVTLAARLHKDRTGEIFPQLYQVSPSQWTFKGSSAEDLDSMLRELAEPSGFALGSRVVPKAEGWPFLSIIRSNQRTFLVQGTEAESVMQFCGWLQINGFRPDRIGSPAPTLVADAAPITFHPSLRFDPYSRAMAKVALNFVCYRLGAELSLHPGFDEVRSFARYGTGSCFDLVCPTLLNHSLEDANAAFFSHGDHGLVLFKAGPSHGGKVGVFIVIQGKTLGRVSLNGSNGVLPEGTWLLTRFSSTKHTVDDYVLPDDMPRAVVNPGALGMRDIWPREWA